MNNLVTWYKIIIINLFREIINAIASLHIILIINYLCLRCRIRIGESTLELDLWMYIEVLKSLPGGRC